MSTDEAKAAIRRLLEEAFGNGDLGVIDEVVADGYVTHDPLLGDVPGRDGLKQSVRTYREGFPDLQITVEDQLAERNQVATRWRARGTQEGDLLGIPPTHRQGTVTGITISRFDGDKIVEDWVNWDALGLMRQLGVVPEPASAPTHA